MGVEQRASLVTIGISFITVAVIVMFLVIGV
jgi:hypothetical protein